MAKAKRKLMMTAKEARFNIARSFHQQVYTEKEIDALTPVIAELNRLPAETMVLVEAKFIH